MIATKNKKKAFIAVLFILINVLFVNTGFSGAYLMCLSTKCNYINKKKKPATNPIIQKLQNCKSFNISVNFKAPQYPESSQLAAISFWPGIDAGYCLPSGTLNGDCLFQPLFTLGEFSTSKQEFQTAPAVWVSKPSGETWFQFGWGDVSSKSGNLFSVKPSDSVQSSIQYKEYNWIQTMSNNSSSSYFYYSLLATEVNHKKSENKKMFVCPLPTAIAVVYFVVEGPAGLSSDQYWGGEIDATVTLTIDSKQHDIDFTDSTVWDCKTNNSKQFKIIPGKNSFKMVFLKSSPGKKKKKKSSPSGQGTQI
jgi:hypothetical protein